MQLLDGPDLQAFRSWWLDFSGFWIADVERAAQSRCNGAVTVNLPASTEDIPLPEIVSRYSDVTSLLTHSVVLVVMLVTLATPKITELNRGTGV